MDGLTDFQRTSAMLAPAWQLDGPLEEYDSQIIFFLTVFRLFGARARVGVVAHEFAHALRAASIGPGWHEKMKRRWRAEEKAADTIAARWGFSRHIEQMRQERRQRVAPLLDARTPEIMRRLLQEE